MACRQMPYRTVLKLKSTTGNTTFLERSRTNYPAALIRNESQQSHATTDLKAYAGACAHLHALSPYLKWTACLLMTQKICQQVVVHPICCRATQVWGASNVIWWGLAILQFCKHSLLSRSHHAADMLLIRLWLQIAERGYFVTLVLRSLHFCHGDKKVQKETKYPWKEDAMNL